MSQAPSAIRGLVPRLQLSRLPRIPSNKVLLLDSVRAARRRLLVLTLLAAAMLAAMLVVAHHSGGSAASSAPRYVLVIDAGSSGTRMYAYTWRSGIGADGTPRLAVVPSTVAPHKVPRRALPGKRAYQRVETEPGLDRFADDPDGLRRKALGPLLEWAEAAVPSNQWESTPVFLFGTAGLRKLTEEQQERLLEGCRAVLGAAAFRFAPPWARIISGADEGVYGWVALNYLAGTLQGGSSSTTSGSSNGSKEGADTLGALDLGGSSLEVTFAADSVPWEEDAVNATVLGANHRLYAHVHHHYGLNDAFDRSISILLARQAPVAGAGSEGGNASSTSAGGSPDDLAQQQQEQTLQPEGAGSGGTAATATVPADGEHSSRTAAEQAGVVASAAAKAAASDAAAAAAAAAAAGGADAASAAGNHWQRSLLQAPEPLRRRLLLSADGNRQQQQQQQQQPSRQLGEAPEVEHPCLHDGYRQAYRRLQLEGAAAPDPPEVVLVGRPDYAACQQLAREVVKADTPCSAPPCALGAPQPSSAGHRFVALTGFYVVYRFFRLPHSAGGAELRAAGREFCGKSWAAVQEERPGELMVQDYCFRAPYIATLLSEGLLLTDEQLQIGDGDVGWTLGAALAEGHRLGGLGHANAIGHSSWGSPGPLWLLVGSASATFLLYMLVAHWWRSPLWLGGATARGAGGGGGGGWLSLVPRSRLVHKISGVSDLSLDTPSSGDASTVRSALSDMTFAGTPLPSGRSLAGGWGGLSAGQPAAVAAAGVAAANDGDVAVHIRSQSWAALGTAPAADAFAGGTSPVLDAAGFAPLSRLGRSRTFSRRSLTSAEAGSE